MKSASSHILKKIRAHPETYTLSFLLILMIWVGSNMTWGDHRWHKLFGSDGIGYYSYLPAVFIYEDLSFSFYSKIQAEHPAGNIKNFQFSGTPEKRYNKYFTGTAVCMAPFFLSAHLLSKMTGQNCTGYGRYYAISIQIAAVCYLLLALIMISRILSRYGVDAINRSVVALCVVFGTNVFYYVIHEPSASHIFSLACISIFVWMAIRWMESQKGKWMLLMAGVFGLILIIRPVNGLVILSIPFLAGSKRKLFMFFKELASKPLFTLLAFLILMAIISIQLIANKAQFDQFYYHSYAGEGFQFKHFNLFHFLFSYRKGFFLWTPLMFFASLGGVYLSRTISRFAAYAWLIFILIVFYVLSSWWQWYYGGSFGSRVMIDYMVYFAIPLGLLLENFKLRKVLVVVLTVFCLVSQIQTYQYAKGYIHWSEMNKDWYWEYFLRLDKVWKKEDKPWSD